MAHKLARLLESLNNKPFLISAPAFNKYAELLEDRNNGIFELSVKDTLAGKKTKELNFNPDTGIGWLNVNGPLTYLTYEGMCGEESGPSYQTLRDETNKLLEAGAKIIVLDSDSPGGEAYQCFETATHIREQADKYGAKVISYVDGISASASYALSSIADEIIVNPQASVGSIGVVVRLRNTNKAMREMGVEDTYIYAGESKVAFDNNGEWEKGFLEGVQKEVDFLYEGFVSHVSNNRGMSKESVINTQARMFMADEAISLGLADKQMTLNEFAEYLADQVEKEKPVALSSLFKLETKKETLNMSEDVKFVELSAQLASAQADLATAQGAVAAIQLEKDKLAELFAKQEEATAELTQQVADMQAAQAQAKLDSRKASLSAVLAADKVETTLASLSALDDAAFATVLEGFAGAKAAVEQSALMQELGSEEEGDAASQEDPAAAATLNAFKNRLQ